MKNKTDPQKIIMAIVVLLLIPPQVWQMLLIAAIPAVGIVIGCKTKKFLKRHKKEVDEYINFLREICLVCKKVVKWVHTKYIVLSPQIIYRIPTK